MTMNQDPDNLRAVLDEYRARGLAELVALGFDGVWATTSASSSRHAPDGRAGVAVALRDRGGTAVGCVREHGNHSGARGGRRQLGREDLRALGPAHGAAGRLARRVQGRQEIEPAAVGSEFG
jgi:hypothetical protein